VEVLLDTMHACVCVRWERGKGVYIDRFFIPGCPTIFCLLPRGGMLGVGGGGNCGCGCTYAGAVLLVRDFVAGGRWRMC